MLFIHALFVCLTIKIIMVRLTVVSQIQTHLLFH